MKTVAIVQSRMTSTRLPGKAMADIEGKTLTERILHRCGMAKKFDEVVLAVPEEREDDPLEHMFSGVCRVYRGSLHDVLDRFWGAARAAGADVIVRVTGDNPLLDPAVMDAAVDGFLAKDIDYGGTARCPLGIGAEVFTFEALNLARREATEQYQREHVTPFFYEKAGRVRTAGLDVSAHLYNLPPDKIRLTVDTADDLEVAREIYRRLLPRFPLFGLKEISELYQDDPALFQRNLHVRQKTFKESQT